MAFGRIKKRKAKIAAAEQSMLAQKLITDTPNMPVDLNTMARDKFDSFAKRQQMEDDPLQGLSAPKAFVPSIGAAGKVRDAQAEEERKRRLAMRGPKTLLG